MPYWWVSEPRINLRLEDRPLGYQPALGPKVDFHASYRQRGSYPHDDDDGVFSLGPDWSCSFRAFLLVQTNWQGQLDIAEHTGGAGLLGYNTTNRSQLYTTRTVSPQSYSVWQINHPNGARDVYSVNFTNGAGTRMIFLNQRIDASGHALTFNYSFPDSTTILLDSITDGDGNTNSIGYNSDPSYPNRIASITDPHGRTCYLYYDSSGVLTNITDVRGLPSTFTYGGYGLSTLTTPYGPTTFEYGGTAVSDASAMYEDYPGPNRWVRIVQPDGGTSLYVFRLDGSAVVPSDWSPVPNLAGGLPNTFDNVDQSRGNSYYWGPRQYIELSTGTVGSLTSTDYKLARQRHWLLDGTASAIFEKPVAIRALSTERAPSPDGSTYGQVTWYDYAGKTYGTNIGVTTLPRCVAKVLPSGETRFDFTERNAAGLVTRRISSYSLPNGTVAYRTNRYVYAANDLDLTLHVGVSGEQVVSNWFNNIYHQPDASYNALGEETKFTYNGDRQLTSVRRPSGLTTTNIYFPSGDYADWLDKTIDLEIGRTNSYTYEDGLVRTHTDERGLTVTSYYDALQRLSALSYPDGTTVSNFYTALDLTATKDRLGFWTTFGYNETRRRSAATNANGIVTLYNHCPCGSLDSVMTAFGTAQQETTTYNYDFQGRLTLTVLPDGTGITNEFDALGQLTATDDGTGPRWLLFNNNQGMVTNVTSYQGDIQNTVYDIEDRPMWVTDANGVTTTNVYDELGRLTTRLWKGGGETNVYSFNISGPTSFTNALSKATRFVYDVAGRKTFETNANSEIISYTYNSAGDLLTLKDGKSQITTWIYDPYGRVTNKLDQSSQEVFRYKYDPNGRLTNRWTPAKGTTTYKYDKIGNLTNVVYPSPTTSITMKYDPLNRLTNMVDAVGTTGYEYFPGGWLASENGPWSSDTVTNRYAKRLRYGLGLQQPTGWWTNAFGYDLARRLTNVASPAGTFGYTHTSVGLVASAGSLIRKISLPGGGSITNDFDAIARLKGTWLKKSNGDSLQSHGYSYNAGHQRTQQTFYSGSTYDYQYDGIGQLKVADSATASEDRGYAYDTAWNLNYRTNNASLQTFSVDGENQLTSAPDGACSYDDNGNLTIALNEGQTLGYDAENQLIEVVTVGHMVTKKTEFTYDGMNRLRVRKEYDWEPEPESFAPSEGGSWIFVSETRYLYDGWRVIQERDGSNVPTVSYTRGTDLSGSLEGAGGIGGLLARSHTYGNGYWTNHNYYFADGNGNITALVDGSGTLQASYRYDPYGNTLSSSGSLASANVYRFSSKEYVGAPAFYYYGYRFYSPNWQRWGTRDPIGERGGKNLYGFVGNRPTIGVDAFGLLSAWGFIKNTISGDGHCCNSKSAGGGTEWALVEGEWIPLMPGECTAGTDYYGIMNFQIDDDCDGMTCNGKFYWIENTEDANCDDENCHNGRNDYDSRAWTPSLSGPNARAPGFSDPGSRFYPLPRSGFQRGAKEVTPPGYTWWE